MIGHKIDIKPFNKSTVKRFAIEKRQLSNSWIKSSFVIGKQEEEIEWFVFVIPSTELVSCRECQEVEISFLNLLKAVQRNEFDELLLLGHLYKLFMPQDEKKQSYTAINDRSFQRLLQLIVYKYFTSIDTTINLYSLNVFVINPSIVTKHVVYDW